MILIDAIYINDSGGKILLDYLIEKIENSKIAAFYLLDKRTENRHASISGNKVKYMEASLLNRLRFYYFHQNVYAKVLCFGNLPPLIKLCATVYTYFHQPLFLKIPKELPFNKKLLLIAKTGVLKRLVMNTDYWLVQSTVIRKGIIKKFNLKADNSVLVLPFYPPVKIAANIIQVKTRFLYVSGGEIHKNHERLIESFKIFYDKHKIGDLHLTIGKDYIELNNKVEDLVQEGYPINNHGFIDRESLTKLYQTAEFAIYPSLTESFGLGIVEALECGCKIIGADRPYMHAICEPSVLFNPESVDEMVLAMEKSVFEETKPSKKLVNNEIERLIEILRCNS